MRSERLAVLIPTDTVISLGDHAEENSCSNNKVTIPVSSLQALIQTCHPLNGQRYPNKSDSAAAYPQ
jgi:hypothetical protein